MSLMKGDRRRLNLETERLSEGGRYGDSSFHLNYVFFCYGHALSNYGLTLTRTE